MLYQKMLQCTDKDLDFQPEGPKNSLKLDHKQFRTSKLSHNFWEFHSEMTSTTVASTIHSPMTSTEVRVPFTFHYLTNEEFEVQCAEIEAEMGKFFAERCRRHYCEIQEMFKDWGKHGTNYTGVFSESTRGPNPWPSPLL